MLPAVAPLFVEDDTTTSSLMLVNDSSVPAGATIIIRDLSGKEIISTHRRLAPHAQNEIAIGSLLAGSPNPPSIGSVSVDQDPDLKGMTVASQLLITGAQRAVPIYIDEELALPSVDDSATLRGVADSALDPALLAISSNVSWAQKLTVKCLFANTISTSATFALLPFATQLVSGCSGRSVTSFSSFESSVNSSGTEKTQAYEIDTDGGAGTITAFGLAPHHHNGDLVFSRITFIDPQKIHSPNTVFAGIPVGPQASLPDGIYSPRLSLANFSPKPANVTVSMATTPENASSSGVGKRILSQLTIPPERTVDMPLDGKSSTSGLLQSLIVESDRQPGDVIGTLVSRSDGTLYEIELLGKDQLDENNGGTHPWSTVGDSVSHLLLFNYSSKPRVFGVGVSNGEIQWGKKYTLAPYETREISINELITDHVKDEKGQVLSANREEGTVNWMVPDSGEGTGRLMVTSFSRAMARNFSCGIYIVACGVTFQTSYAYIGPALTVVDEFLSEANFCDEFSPSFCVGGNSVGFGSANYNWSVGPSSVIQLNSPSDQYSQDASIYSNGGGSGWGNVTAEAGGCSVGGTGGLTVLALGSLTLTPTPLIIGNPQGSTFSLSGSGFPIYCADITFHPPAGVTVNCGTSSSKVITGSISASSTASPTNSSMYISVQNANSNPVQIPMSY